MEFIVKKAAGLIVFGLLLGFSACDKMDMPGMFVERESVNSRFEQSETWNKNHGFSQTEVPADDYTVSVAADIHMGGTANFDRFVADSKTMKAAAVVLNGDVTTGRFADYQVLQQHLPDKKELNYYMMTGNHDLFYNGWTEFYRLFGSATYYFTVKSPKATDLYICVDTGNGTLGTLQLNWLEKVLREVRPQYRNCIVFTHCNLYQSKRTLTSAPLQEETILVMEMFVKYNVNMVIAGHEHNKDVTKLGNTTYIIMDSLKDDNDNPSYLKLTVKDGVIAYEFVNV